MSDHNNLETAVSKPLPKLFTFAAWGFIIIICLVSVTLSGMAYQRSKLDNDALRNITNITERLEKLANKLDSLAANSNAFNRDSSDFLHQNDRTAADDYNALSQKYNNSVLGTDDGSSKWLFTQNDDKRSQ